VVGSQTASLTPGLSFAHNLGDRCPNAQCEGIFDIYVSRPFQWHQEHPNARCFSPCCWALNIRESRRTPNPNFSKCWASPPHLAKVGLRHSWPLKVGNRHLPNIWIKSATRRWKDLKESYNFGLDLVAIRLYSRELWAPKSLGTPTRTISGQFRDSNLGVPGKSVIRMQLPQGAAENTIWGKVVASPESGPWWVLWVKVPVACPNTQGCSQMLINPFVVGFGCRFKLDLLVPLPSLIPGLLACPSTPL